MTIAFWTRVSVQIAPAAVLAGGGRPRRWRPSTGSGCSATGINGAMLEGGAGALTSVVNALGGAPGGGDGQIGGGGGGGYFGGAGGATTPEGNCGTDGTGGGGGSGYNPFDGGTSVTAQSTTPGGGSDPDYGDAGAGTGGFSQGPGGWAVLRGRRRWTGCSLSPTNATCDNADVALVAGYVVLQSVSFQSRSGYRRCVLAAFASTPQGTGRRRPPPVVPPPGTRLLSVTSPRRSS